MVIGHGCVLARTGARLRHSNKLDVQRQPWSRCTRQHVEDVAWGRVMEQKARVKAWWARIMEDGHVPWPAARTQGGGRSRNEYEDGRWYSSSVPTSQMSVARFRCEAPVRAAF